MCCVQNYITWDLTEVECCKIILWFNVKNEFMAHTVYYGLVQYRPTILQYSKLLVYYRGFFLHCFMVH